MVRTARDGVRARRRCRVIGRVLDRLGEAFAVVALWAILAVLWLMGVTEMED